MQISTIKNNIINKILPVLFWILIWQLISMSINQEILIVSPISVMKTLVELVQKINFWNAICFSFSRIIIGFVFGTITGTMLAYLSYKNVTIRILINPIMSVIKATPVVSFIIFALIWISSKNLSILIAFLMVLPIIYNSVYQGIINVDKKMIEMSKVFSIKWYKRLIYIYIPEILPFFISATSVALGFSWKSGIAAEIIGIPSGSIGEKLYTAKLFLNTKEIFAWTVVIIIISVIFEKIFMRLVKLLEAKWKYN